MKKFTLTSIIAMILAVSASLTADELYYYGGGKRIFLFLYEDVVSIEWRVDVSRDQKEGILTTIPNIRSHISIERYQVTILRISPADAKTILKQLSTLPEIEFVHSLLYVEENDTLVLTNEIGVKLKPSLTVENLEKEYEVKLIREDPFDDTYKILKVLRHSRLNSLEIANMLTESGMVEFACPNFIRKIDFDATPNDYYYPNQWALPKVDTPLAWDYETGSSNIVVAVLDQGVDLDHPDLGSIIVPGYDAVDNDNVPQCNPYDGHGTCCAGIIAAITHNNIGVAGIAGGWSSAGGCRIMPIRIAEGYNFVADSDIKYCFEWAVGHGAKILSNSWGGGPYSDIIVEGIQYAVDHDCLVFFSSGNTSGQLSFPAYVQQCIAVGATDQNDVRWYYSAYGNGLDITAPSGDVNLQGDIWTTDNTGNDGYYPSQCPTGSPDGNYMGNFGGTSAACPHAVGVAALMWSRYPSASAATIRYVLEHDSEDLGAIGWDQYYGWGRINCLAPLVCCQPDNHVKCWWDANYIGNDVYNSTGAGQSVLQFADPYQWAEYHVKIQNDGTTPDIINVTATEQGTGDWTTRYYDALSGGNDITGQITSTSGWSAGMVDAGACIEIQVKVKPGGSVNGMIKTVNIASRTQDPSTDKIDMAKMITQCNVLQPDNQIKKSNETVYVGNNIYNTTGQNQTKNQDVSRNQTATYHVKVENDGETYDVDWINGPGGDSHWSIEYFDAITGGNNITYNVVNGIYWVYLSSPGATAYLRVEVTPSSSCPWNEQKDVLVTATAGYNANKKDAVKAVTKCSKYQQEEDRKDITGLQKEEGVQAQESQVIEQFAVESIHPNPFKGVLRIRLYSPDSRSVSINMYDIQGRLVNQMLASETKIGINELTIPNEGLAAGVYFLSVNTDGYEEMMRVILLQ